MIASATVALIVAATVGGPSGVGIDTAGSGPRLESARIGIDEARFGVDEARIGIDSARIGIDAAPSDTIKPRRHAVRLSDAYYSRLRLHRLSSYAMLPMFAFEYAAGQQLMQKSSAAPAWARVGHRIVATSMLVSFGVNTYTGALNWYETRNQESGLGWRTVHSALMLISDAGFSMAGQLSKPAETSLATRRLHKQVAITSMGIATVSYVMMLKPFRRD